MDMFGASVRLVLGHQSIKGEHHHGSYPFDEDTLGNQASDSTSSIVHENKGQQNRKDYVHNKNSNHPIFTMHILLYPGRHLFSDLSWWLNNYWVRVNK